MTDPWDFRAGMDTTKSFHAFEHYLQLASHERSVRVAWSEHQENCRRRTVAPDQKKAGRNWDIWSAQNDWIARAQAP